MRSLAFMLLSILAVTLVGYVSAVVSLAAPWADAPSSPTGSVNGGTAVLIPFVQGGAVTDARVDNGNGAAAILSFNNSDTADALDEAKLDGQVNDVPASGTLRVEWRAELSAGIEAYVGVVNGPGRPDQHKPYSTSSDVSANAQLTNLAGGGTPVISVSATVSIQNEVTGELRSPMTLDFRDLTDPANPTPHKIMGDGRNLRATLRYSVGAKCTLVAERPEVDVKAYGKRAAPFFGQLIAWDVTDPNNPVVVKKRNGVTDAIWQTP